MRGMPARSCRNRSVALHLSRALKHAELGGHPLRDRDEGLRGGDSGGDRTTGRALIAARADARVERNLAQELEPELFCRLRAPPCPKISFGNRIRRR